MLNASFFLIWTNIGGSIAPPAPPLPPALLYLLFVNRQNWKHFPCKGLRLPEPLGKDFIATWCRHARCLTCLLTHMVNLWSCFVNFLTESHHFNLSESQIIDYDGRIQLWSFAYVRLLNKPYENEVPLRGQNIPLKCCQPLELLKYIEREFRSIHTVTIGSVVQRSAKLLSVKLWEWFGPGRSSTWAAQVWFDWGVS